MGNDDVVTFAMGPGIYVDDSALPNQLKPALKSFLQANPKFRVWGSLARKTKAGNIAIKFHGKNIVVFVPDTRKIISPSELRDDYAFSSVHHAEMALFCQTLQQKLDACAAEEKAPENLKSFSVTPLAGKIYEVNVYLQKDCLYRVEPIVLEAEKTPSAETEYDKVIKNIHNAVCIPQNPFPWEKMKERAVRVICKERPFALTDKEVGAAAMPCFYELFGPVLKETLEAYAEEPSLNNMKTSFTSAGTECRAVLSYGNVKVEISLLTGAETVTGLDNPKAAQFRQLYRKRNWLESFMEETEGRFPDFDFKYKYMQDSDSVQVSVKGMPVSAAVKTGKAYKRILSAMGKDIKTYEQQKEAARMDAFRGRYGYGDIAVTAFLETVMLNSGSVTENMVIKKLRGMASKAWTNVACKAEYSGKFALVHADVFAGISRKLLKEGTIKARTIKGTYAYFDVLTANDIGKDIIAGKDDIKPGKGKPKTEFQELEAIKKENPEKQSLKAVMARIGYLLEHPAVYCYGKKDVERYLSHIPEQAAEYLKAAYKMENPGIKKKYAKALMEAANAVTKERQTKS